MKYFFYIWLVIAAALNFSCAPSSKSETTVHKFCGVRSGTAGNAFLVDEGKTVITLAVQGGSQSLLEQTDKLIELLGPDGSGETGTQNGSRYCVKAEVVGKKPVLIVDAARD